MPHREVFEAWRIADQEASAAERSLKERFAAYLRGDGPEPSHEEARQAKRLRALAMERLNAYIRAAAPGSAPATGGGPGSDW